MNQTQAADHRQGKKPTDHCEEEIHIHRRPAGELGNGEALGHPVPADVADERLTTR